MGRPLGRPFFVFTQSGGNISARAAVFNVSMKPNKILILTTAAALIAGGLLTNSFAAESSPATTTPAATPLRGMILKRIAEKLNLTDDQKSQIKTILGAEKDTLAPLLTQLHDARKNLRAAIRASDANEAACARPRPRSPPPRRIWRLNA
jgi:hypothetical protein